MFGNIMETSSTASITENVNDIHLAAEKEQKENINVNSKSDTNVYENLKSTRKEFLLKFPSKETEYKIEDLSHEEERISSDNCNKQQISFLRWINPFSYNNNNNSNALTLENHKKSSNNKKEEILLNKRNSLSLNTDFKSVQNLKQLWNNRISSSTSEATKKQSTLPSNRGRNSFDNCSVDSSKYRENLNLSKSIDCLSLISDKKSSIDDATFPCSVDNFNKYKTAANIKEQRKLQFSLSSDSNELEANGNQIGNRKVFALRKSHSEDHKIEINSFGSNFPLVATTKTGEKIHWAKREDIVAYQKQKQTKPEEFCAKKKKLLGNSASFDKIATTSLSTLRISSGKDREQNSVSNNKTESDFVKREEEIGGDTDKIRKLGTNCSDKWWNTNKMAIKSSVTTKALITTKISDKTDNNSKDNKSNNSNGGGTARSASISENGSSNSLQSSNVSTARKKITGTTVGPRKYSFKTHCRSFHHTPRKMATNNSGGSKVAALTHQFNQMIQKDGAILKEVQKKNGILMSRAGHVYKVKTTTVDDEHLRNNNRKRISLKRATTVNGSGDDDEVSSLKSTSNSGKRKSIKRQTCALKGPQSSSRVQTAVKKIEEGNKITNSRKSKGNSESNLSSPTLQKPEVPLKNEQVLQRTKEIVIRNSQKKSKSCSSVLETGGRIEKPPVILEDLEELKEENSFAHENEEKSVDNSETLNERNETENRLENDSIKIDKNEDTSVKCVVPECPDIVDSPQNKNSIPNSDSSENKEIKNQQSDIAPKKSKYLRIYEKFIFRPFSSSKKSSQLTNQTQSTNGTILQQSSSASLASKLPPVEQKSFKIDEEMNEDFESERKLVEALQTVNKKIDRLSKSTVDVTSIKTDAVLLQDRLTDERSNPYMQPNDSFLFNRNYKTAFIPATADETPSRIAEAVNVSLINKTRSMDEIRPSAMKIRQISLEEREYPDILKKTDEILEKFKKKPLINTPLKEEDLYESIESQLQEKLIRPNKNESCPEEITKHSGEHNIPTGENCSKSFIFKSHRSRIGSSSSYQTKESLEDDESIYQTVSEVRQNIKEEKDFYSTNGYEFYDDYECVTEELPTSSSLDNKSSNTAKIEEDGYEVCDPPEPPPPRKVSTDTVEVRKTTDELPAIPVPKRNIQNSPNELHHRMPNSLVSPPRPAKSPQISNTKLPEIPRESNSEETINGKLQQKRQKCSSNIYSGDVDETYYEDDEHHYDDENIYDIIKTSENLSHCYEALLGGSRPNNFEIKSNSTNREHGINGKKSCSGKSTLDDSISMTSNGYESINSYRRISISLRKSDSVSTLSSEQKTNSLYGVSLGQTQLITDYRRNLSKNSDKDDVFYSDGSSDEWIDISDDGDEEMENTKQRFIVVREPKPKCHRSPDWSQRVRDQRIHHQQVIEYGEDHGIYSIKSFKMITQNELDKLFPLHEMELMMEFRENLMKWRAERDLNNYLSSCGSGQKILKVYEENNGILPSHCRDILVKDAVKHYLDNNSFMHDYDFRNVCDQICCKFNGEQPIDIDFEEIFGKEKNNCIFSAWDTFVSKIKPILKKKIKDKLCLNILDGLENTKDKDDSDHYYEPLYITKEEGVSSKSGGHSKHTLKSLRTTNGNNQRRMPSPGRRHAAGDNFYSDEYDSFDSDDYSDEETKKHDSGVDVSNIKLPDPPAPPNQVYAFVRKVKNLITSKKKPSQSTTSTKSSDSGGKSYENTQFYVELSGNQYQNTEYEKKPYKTVEATQQTLNKTKTPKSCKKQTKSSSLNTPDEIYENADFHRILTSRNNVANPPVIGKTSPSLYVGDTQKDIISSPNTTMPSPPTLDKKPSESPPPVTSIVTTTEVTTSPPEIVARKKTKSGKSFKSKLRKSLGGSMSDYGSSMGNGLNGSRSTFYISDSVDVDSGIFEKAPNSDSNLSQTSAQETISPSSSATTSVEAISSTTVPSLTRETKKMRSPDFNRRRTTIGIRPNDPPPPPPVDKKGQKKRPSTTSWYAECGVFKAATTAASVVAENQGIKDERKDRISSTSWYAEAGLYQTSGASVASSSGSSGVSTGGEGGPGDDNPHSMFLNEPLYQFYTAEKLESISQTMEDQESTDGYEEIGTLNIKENKRSSRPSALQLVGPKQGPSRTLWSEVLEVINSAILSTLTPTERRLQEAKFEILTSEASYFKSLNLLRTHFMNHPAFRDASVLKPTDRKTLFSHIVPVHECSDRLLSDLENCWQDSIMLLGLSKSLYKHAEKYFHVYISFCEHQGKMDRTLRRLKEAKGTFSQTLEMLESDPLCCGLNLHSFLMLPMQRITRLPLLIDAVFSKLKPDSDEYEEWKMTLAILNKIVSQCNEAAKRCEQAFEIERISRQLEFPSSIRSIAIAPVGIPAPCTKPRTLVKKGDLVHLIWKGDDAKLTFGKKFAKSNIYAFLFTDLIVLTKRKGEETFSVFDYCSRSMLTISAVDSISQLPIKEISNAGKNLIYMTLLENHEKKTVEMLISCPSVSEQQRWLEATTPPEPEVPGEKLYEEWDCPQVITKHEFSATEPDHLSLEPGDVVNVMRKMADGWYQGERIRDGVKGWFPGNFTEEVNSPHVRARNLKQRYRLLTFTASYLESQKKK